MAKYSQEIEVHGHLIDSLILTKIFDKIMDVKGEFEVLEINIGKRKRDESYARLLVQGRNQKHLDEILDFVYREGATSKIQNEVHLKLAPKNMVMPTNFYSTTNNHTQIFYKNRWIEVGNMMMDKCIIVKDNKAFCIPIRDVKKGNKIVVGEKGIKITPPERPREGLNVFEFMGSNSSSERPTQHIAKQVAKDIYKTKKDGGKIILVGGPAIVHTGAADSIALLIRHGFIDAILAGNALAVHDIEYSTLGTSLGMNVNDGTLAVRGHRNHMDAINAVFAAGSISNMVRNKKLKKGIMYECQPFRQTGELFSSSVNNHHPVAIAGEFPNLSADLQALLGIFQYLAAELDDQNHIDSIAFRKRLTSSELNVRGVLTTQPGHSGFRALQT